MYNSALTRGLRIQIPLHYLYVYVCTHVRRAHAYMYGTYLCTYRPTISHPSVRSALRMHTSLNILGTPGPAAGGHPQQKSTKTRPGTSLFSHSLDSGCVVLPIHTDTRYMTRYMTRYLPEPRHTPHNTAYSSTRWYGPLARFSVVAVADRTHGAALPPIRWRPGRGSRRSPWARKGWP
jgi:hypothetical protein